MIKKKMNCQKNSILLFKKRIFLFLVIIYKGITMQPKHILIFINVLFFFLPNTIKAQSFEWAKSMGNPSTNTDIGTSVVIDRTENVYTIGTFYGTVDFDPGVGVYNLTGCGSFISKLDSNGNFVWARHVVCPSFRDIVLDSANNIYITGSFSGTTDFDPGIGIANLVSVGGNDIFVSKWDSNGNFVWARQMGGSSGEGGNSIALDDLGNIYTTGTFSGSADFNPGIDTAYLTVSGGSAFTGNIFVSKLNASGAFVWAKKMGGIDAAAGQSIIIGFDGIYIAGQFRGTADFDPSAGVFNLTSANDDIFVCKLDILGSFVWAKNFGNPTPYTEEHHDMVLDVFGNIYIAGKFRETVDFDPNIGVANLTCIGSNGFIAKWDALGNFIWVKNIGGINPSIFIDDFKEIYVTGYFSGVIDFDPDTIGIFDITCIGSADMFVTKLDSFGNFVWAKSMGGTQASSNGVVSMGITVGLTGNIYTTGAFNGTADFDPNAGIFNLTTVGGDDIFIHKMNSSLPTPITKTETPLPITLYPNPSNGVLHLEIAQDFRSATIEIINTLGQVLARTQTSDRNSRLVLPDAVGVYFVRVEVEGKVGVYRVVRE